MQSYIERVEFALKELQKGRMILLTDNPDRENEGDFIMPAETMTTESMNFIIRNSSGIVCISLPESAMHALNLNYMVPPHENTSCRATPFTVSIDAKEGVTTGVSSADRVATIQAVIKDGAKPDDLQKPGHIFPLLAKAGGVLERQGHTEGALDIVTLAGFKPAAVLCEVMNPDGTMARGKQLVKFAKKHALAMLSIDDIISYRYYRENLIIEEITTELPITNVGTFKLSVVKEKITGLEHAVLEKPNKDKTRTTLVRIHSACLTGDIFGSMRCDCNQQLHYSLERINQEGGILIYLNQEGRGIGLFNKIKAYALQDKGFDTIEANQKLGLPVDSRLYYIAANILRNRTISRVRLLTNNPAKLSDLKKYGILHVEKETMPGFSNQHNQRYLTTKKHKLNHSINDNLINM